MNSSCQPKTRKQASYPRVTVKTVLETPTDIAALYKLKYKYLCLVTKICTCKKWCHSIKSKQKSDSFGLLETNQTTYNEKQISKSRKQE